MRTRFYYSILLFLLAYLPVQAQLNCTFTHYSQENGLSENTVMAMTQDHDGMLWFATWDGINRFDGYDFHVYKARKSNDMEWASNRVDYLCVDTRGNVWCIAYDGHVFRFDKRRETFDEIPAQGPGRDLVITSIVTLDNGTVWLLAGSDGGIRILPEGKEKKEEQQVFLSSACGEKGTHIYGVHLDNKGNEWLLTRNGLLRIDPNGKETTYFTDAHPQGEHSKQAFFDALEADGIIWFTSRQGRVWTYDIANDVFTLDELPCQDDLIAIRSLKNDNLVFAAKKQGIILTDKQLNPLHIYGAGQEFDFARWPIVSIYIDSHDEIWLGVDRAGCVCHLNPETGSFKVEQMNVEKDPADRSVPEFSICENRNGNLWVHPVGGGLSWFDRSQNRLVPFYDEAGSSTWRFSNKLHAMMTDRQGNLWLGTHSKGLEKVSFFDNEFHLYKPLPCNYDTHANQIRALCEDKQKRIWAGTRDGKIAIFSSDMKPLGHLTTDGRIASSGTPLVTPAYRILEDSHGTIWIASKGGGVIHLEPRDNGNAYRLTQYTSDANDIYSLSHNSAYDICEDGQGRLWVATFGGGVNYIEPQPDGSFRFIHARNNLKAYPMERCYKARSLQRDTKGTMWVATANGLLSFDENFTRPEAITFHLHARTPGDAESLSNNDIYDMLLTRQGHLFFATFGGGLNELKGMDEKGNARFASYNTTHGLPTDVLVSLAEDMEGNVWIGTESGLSRMDTERHHFDNFLRRELGEELMFEENTAIALSDGRLLFGSNRGLLVCLPDEVKINDYVPDIVFAGLKIANETIMPAPDSVLPESLNSLEELVLPHTKNTLALSFAALDMNFPENIKYAYILEGFDKEWNYVDQQRIATYTNLPQGEYTFRIRSTNGAGVWVDNERRLSITIQPAFWETPIAYALYVIVFLAIVLGGAYTLFVIYRLKHEVSIEQQVTDIKLRFFTNISHELRTPLTLIEGPLSYIMQRDDLTREVREQLQVVERNTHRMLRLVNQILDFRKIQNNKMKLCVEQVDVVPFVRKIMANFESIAESNKIDFIFENERPSLKLWIDTDKVEKIIFNLLSNAFKYTPQGKSIKVFIHENEETVAIGVQDQGIGIPESMKKSLFVRFETLFDKHLTGNSTGIGLSLAKELAELHHATIRVDSKEGEGSCFTVEFKKGKEHFGEQVEFIVSDNVEVLPEKAVSDAGTDTPQAEKASETESPANRKTMLLVEDNLELRFFLRNIFQAEFQIIEASNGTEGTDKAREYIPDIIISDIMMPEKDGIALTKDLRSDVATSHIPIVLLTAKTDMESKLQGMELGVDSYITKPFSAVYLKARVENLLARRQRMRQFYYEHLMDINNQVSEEEAKVEEEAQNSISPQDKRFLDHLTDFMEQNLDNGDLIVDDLVKEMGVSRSVFFKKLKSLTGFAPIEFIKEMRVKRAAQLIETGEFNMTQIAYMVGINDPRYFSKCFKQRFDMTPTEYKEKVRKGTRGQGIS